MLSSVAALLASLLALCAGPALLRLGSSTVWRAATEGLSLTLVGGLCLVHLAPHALEHGGPWALAGMLSGLALPHALSARSPGAPRWLWLVAAPLASVHAALDGAALALPEGGLGGSMALAVVAHRLPVGLAVAERMRRNDPSGRRLLGALVGLGLATVAGFWLGAGLIARTGELDALLEGLVTGGLLHVVLAPSHAPTGPRQILAPARQPAILALPRAGRAGSACSHPDHVHPTDTLDLAPHAHATGPAEQRRWSALGALAGLVLLGAFTWASGRQDGALAHVRATAEALVTLTLASAPALLAGFVLAGLISAFLDPARMSWLAMGGRTEQALRGVVFGLPLPVCSCGVVPLYQSLVRRGVPTAAAMAFLVATPELGLDAVLLSLPLLGGPMTAARVGCAFGVALLVGIWVGGSAPAAGLAAPSAGMRVAQGWQQRLVRGMRFGLYDLVDHTLPWVAVGLLVAALAEPLFEHDLLLALPAWLQVPIAAAVGVPLYVCASGATPLAAMAIHKGLSSGAALAFLLSGPASNLTTFGVLSALHGRAVAVRFGVALVVLAVLAGWGVNAAGLSAPPLDLHGGAHDHGTALLGWGCALVLAALGCASLFRQGAQGVIEQLRSPIHLH
jgi:uncharacterized membrane protein YraQ (UPF0718 family)